MTNYSNSKCPKCERTLFEVVEDTPAKSNFKFFYLRCSSCRTIITALPWADINTRLTKLAKALNVNLDI